MASDSNNAENNNANYVKKWKRLWIGIIVSYGALSIFSLLFFPEFFLPNLTFVVLFGLIILITFFWQRSISKEKYRKKGTTLKSVYWKRYWIALFISYVGSSIVLIIFLKEEFIRFLILSIIFGVALIGAYYIRVRPSLMVNKILYTSLGVTLIGFGLCLLYGLIGISRFLISLGSWYIYLNLIDFAILMIIGGILGFHIGKRRDFRLPYSLH